MSPCSCINHRSFLFEEESCFCLLSLFISSNEALQLHKKELNNQRIEVINILPNQNEWFLIAKFFFTQSLCFFSLIILVCLSLQVSIYLAEVRKYFEHYWFPEDLLSSLLSNVVDWTSLQNSCLSYTSKFIFLIIDRFPQRNQKFHKFLMRSNTSRIASLGITCLNFAGLFEHLCWAIIEQVKNWKHLDLPF